MPNWCLNTLRINGDSQHIQELPWNNRDRLFHPLIPLPENLTPEKQLQWAIQHWGVKWDCFVEVADSTEDYLELEFDTPWAAPINGIGAISKMFPLLSFEMTSTDLSEK